MKKLLIFSLIAISGFSITSPVIANAKEPNRIMYSTGNVMSKEEWQSKVDELNGLARVNFTDMIEKIIVDTFRYTDLKDEATKNFLDGLEDGLQELNGRTVYLEWSAINTSFMVRVINNNGLIDLYTIQATVTGNATFAFSELSFNSGDKPISEISKSPSSLYQLGIMGGRTPDGLVIPTESTTSMRVNLEVNPELSMNLTEDAVTVDPAKVGKFDVRPNITTNMAYKITMENDGKLKDAKGSVIQSGVNLTYSDTNASAVTGNVLTYPKSIKNTVISASFGDLSKTDPGLLHMDIDVVLAPQ